MPSVLCGWDQAERAIDDMPVEELQERLEAIIQSAKISKRYCKQAMIRSHQNICVYGLGKFFQDVFEDRGFKEKLGVNYLSDADECKWRKKFCGIECVPPDTLKSIEDLVVIILIGGDITTLEQQFKAWEIPCVSGFELLLEMSIDGNISEAEFEKNQILDAFQSFASWRSKEIYVELLANRLAPEFSRKSYSALSSPVDYFDTSCYKITDHESFVDCGAYNGDTIRSFLKIVKNFDGIYSFEMDQSNYDDLLAYIDTLDAPERTKIHCYHAGVWNEKGLVKYGNEEKSSTESFSILKSTNGTEVAVDKLDNMLKDQKVTWIKMDIEGAELNALIGAEQIIKRQRPKLAICLYHKLEDFWKIPFYLKKIVPDYQLEIRHHRYDFYGTVLYAR